MALADITICGSRGTGWLHDVRRPKEPFPVQEHSRFPADLAGLKVDKDSIAFVTSDRCTIRQRPQPTLTMQTATAMDVTPATVNQTGEVLLTMSAEAPSPTRKRRVAALVSSSRQKLRTRRASRSRSSSSPTARARWPARR